MGLNFSAHPNTTQSRPAGLILHGTYNMDSNSSYSVSNIPSDAVLVRISFRNLSVSSSGGPRYYLNFGSSTGVDTNNNYRWGNGYYDNGGQSGNGTSAHNNFRIVTSAHTNANHRECGYVDFAKSSQGWVGHGQFTDYFYSQGINYHFSGVWMVNAPIQIIRMVATNGTFNNSSIMVIHYQPGEV